MGSLITPSGITGILSIGSGLFNAIKPLVILLLGAFIGLGILEFLFSIFSTHTEISKKIVITENRVINTALDKVHSKYTEYISLAKQLGIKLSKKDIKELATLEANETKEILTKRFNELKDQIYNRDKKNKAKTSEGEGSTT